MKNPFKMSHVYAGPEMQKEVPEINNKNRKLYPANKAVDEEIEEAFNEIEVMTNEVYAPPEIMFGHSEGENRKSKFRDIKDLLNDL